MIEKGSGLDTLRFEKMRNVCSETSSIIRNIILQMDIGSMPVSNNISTFSEITGILDKAKEGLIISLKTAGMSKRVLRDLIIHTSPEMDLDLENLLLHLERSLNPASNFRLPDEATDTWAFVKRTHSK